MIKEGMNQVFAGVVGHRSLRNQKHPFTSLLGISLLGALSGIDSFNGLGDYSQMHFDSLSHVFELPNGPSSHDTFQRLFEAIEPGIMKIFLFNQQLSSVLEDVVAIDGKTVRKIRFTLSTHGVRRIN